MILLGLVSSYLEGELLRGAVESLLEARCDQVLCLEGPAGEPIEADVPASDLGAALERRVTLRSGRWRTDARKRQAMLEWAHAQKVEGETLWGVIVDADEVLVNGRYLRDWLLRLDYHEQLNPEAQYLGRPLRLMELDGSLAWLRGRLLRLDRITKYKVSTSVFETTQGLYTNAGNLEDSYTDWARPRAVYLEGDRMVVRPPLPTEPFLVHRSLLRHPLRSGLRMHEQERSELLAAGMKVDAQANSDLPTGSGRSEIHVELPAASLDKMNLIRQFLAVSPSPEEQPDETTVTIDRLKFVLPERPTTGRDLRQLGNPPVSDDYDLWMIVPGHDDELVRNDDVLDPIGFRRFFTSPRVINAGRFPFPRGADRMSDRIADLEATISKTLHVLDAEP